MMRRKNTSRRVHALSSGSMRSDEIAATDMALSRDWSRAEVSDIANRRSWAGKVALRCSLGPPEPQNQLLLRQIKGAVTRHLQGVRIGTDQISLLSQE